MAKNEAPTTRQGGGGGSIIAAVVAVLAVGGFLAWLATRPATEQVAVVEPAANATAPATTDAVAVDPADLNVAARVDELRGQNVRLARVEVVASLGPQLFWMQLPGGTLFLAKMDAELVERGVAAPSSGNYEVVGRVLEKSDALLAEWQQAGVIRSDGDRMQAEYGTSYIEARQVRPVGG